MKIRTDFVTNSSSSSFILAFKDQNDINEFKSDCKMFDFGAFYELIDDLSSDFLKFENDTKNSIPIRPLIDKIKHIDFGFNAYCQIMRLYDDDYQLKPYESVTVKINDFGNKEVDLDELAFEDIDENDYAIRVINNQPNQDKNDALQQLRWEYASDFIWKLLDEKFPRDNYESYDEFDKARDEYKKTDEYVALVEQHIADPEYFEKKEMIENAELIVSGMIWDTSGGLLEWAIRNGFIEQNFYRNCVRVLNVG